MYIHILHLRVYAKLAREQGLHTQAQDLEAAADAMARMLTITDETAHWLDGICFGERIADQQAKALASKLFAI